MPLDFEIAVAHVLEGKSAQGDVLAKAKKIAFSQDTAKIAGLVKACEALHDATKGKAALDTDQDQTVFIQKLAIHALKQRWHKTDSFTAAYEAEVEVIAAAINNAPDVLLNSKAGIAKLVEVFESDQKLIAEKTPIKWEGGDYQLVELFTPQDLIEQGKSVGGVTCVGKNHNYELLRQNGLKKGDPGAEEYLTYAVKIRSGESRIFSLRRISDGKADVTIEYKPGIKTITQIEDETMGLSQMRGYFTPLCQALGFMRDEFEIDMIKRLPEIRRDQVLLRDGRVVEVDTMYDATDVLQTGKENAASRNLYAIPDANQLPNIFGDIDLALARANQLRDNMAPLQDAHDRLIYDHNEDFNPEPEPIIRLQEYFDDGQNERLNDQPREWLGKFIEEHEGYFTNYNKIIKSYINDKKFNENIIKHDLKNNKPDPKPEYQRPLRPHDFRFG